MARVAVPVNAAVVGDIGKPLDLGIEDEVLHVLVNPPARFAKAVGCAAGAVAGDSPPVLTAIGRLEEVLLSREHHVRVVRIDGNSVAPLAGECAAVAPCRCPAARTPRPH